MMGCVANAVNYGTAYFLVVWKKLLNFYVLEDKRRSIVNHSILKSRF